MTATTATYPVSWSRVAHGGDGLAGSMSGSLRVSYGNGSGRRSGGDGGTAGHAALEQRSLSAGDEDPGEHHPEIAIRTKVDAPGVGAGDVMRLGRS